MNTESVRRDCSQSASTASALDLPAPNNGAPDRHRQFRARAEPGVARNRSASVPTRR